MGLRIVTVKMPPELVHRIDRVARRLGVSRSELIRRAAEELLRRLGG